MKNFLIVGLGNPGEKYKYTRHNIGFSTVDFLADKKWQKSKKADYFYLKMNINGHNVELVKPQTFMNNSGKAVNYIMKKHSTSLDNLIVIHDDIDLMFGDIKLQRDRSSAGHKGVQSIIDSIGTKDFVRLRFGIGPQKNSLLDKLRIRKPTEKYVLEKFSKNERGALKELLAKAIEKIKDHLIQQA